MKLHSFLPAALLALPLATVPVSARPAVEPQGVNDLPAWKMDLELSAPKAFVVARRDGTARTVWYVAFKVKNATGGARKLSPFVSLAIDTGKSYPAACDPEALEGVRLREGAATADLFDLGGELADGDTRKAAAIFEGVDPLANHYTFQFSGFAAPLVRSGKDYTQRDSVYRASFHRYGNEFRQASSPITCVSGEWVNVNTKKVR